MDITTTVQVSFFANETDDNQSSKRSQLKSSSRCWHSTRYGRISGVASCGPRLSSTAPRKGDNLIESSLLAFDIDDGTPPDQVSGMAGRSDVHRRLDVLEHARALEAARLYRADRSDSRG